MQENKTDKLSFSSILVAIVCITLPIALKPSESEVFIRQIYLETVNIFGSSYMVLGIITLVFLLILSLSKYGTFILGGENAKPEFKNFSWGSMLFCSGIGGGILYWSGVEWAYYVSQPPFGIEPFSEEAYHLSSAYGIFHWGLGGWALYCLPAIAIAVPFYHFKLGSLRLSSGIRSSQQNPIENSIIGRIIDFIFVIVVIGASGGTMGMYIPVISAGIAELFDVPHDIMLDLGMLFVCTCLFAFSVFKGIKKGIRVISNINVIMALIFLMCILLLGSFQEIINLTIEAIKSLIKNFSSMSTLGIKEKSTFADNWTIFYWAWWIALGPQVGLFIARVSKGRTLRELILGMLFLGSLGCFLFFAIIGNYAINLEINNQLMVTEILANEGHRIAATQILLSLPFGKVFLFTYCIIVIIFIATSYDSVSYLLAYHVKRTSSEVNEPSKKMRLFWAIVLAILPASLFLVNSHRAAMDVILLMSPPLLILFPIFAISIVRTLKNHYSASDQ